MNIYIHGFWNGFTECTDPVNVGYFITLLSKVFNTCVTVSTNATSADILLESIFTNKTMVHSKKWKYTFMFTGESRMNQHVSSYSCILGYKETRNKYVCLPLFNVYIHCNTYLYNPVTTRPDKMVCAVISNSGGHVRNTFLDRLGIRMPVSYGGPFRNNIGGVVGGMHNSDTLIEFYRQFRFVITMENSREDFYITEKIINGLRAGVIPVYWGSLNVGTYFNERRFLQLRGDSDSEMDALIHRMLTMTEDEYMSIVREPIFKIEDMEDRIVADIKTCLRL